METYKKLNNYFGWLTFVIASIVFLATVESTVSLWDCGEYITAAHKLEVGHPPGAPFFMLLGALFSSFASPDSVAIWINRMSALSSSFAILFMFWSITMLVKKMIFKQYNKRDLTKGEIIAIIGSGLIGSLVYTFTDTFWFSAVEGEVYAMSSLFTAVIFWAILKWDEEMQEIEFKEINTYQNSLKWLILIMFLIGLAIGVHLLGLLVVPTIVFFIYFNQSKNVNLKGILLVGILSVVLLVIIQNGIIPGTVALASKFEIFFVNSLGAPFFSGAIFFVVIVVTAFYFLIRYSRKNNKPVLHAILLGLLVLLMGYGSFATIVIRSNANTPLDENDPENLVTLQSYLMREQYGTWPILTGPYWNSVKNDVSQYDNSSAKYIRRFVATDGDRDVKAFKHEADAQKFVNQSKSGYEVIEKYYVYNKDFIDHQEITYAQTTFFPRMWYTLEPGKIEGYKNWSGYDPSDVTASDQTGADGLRLPRMSENLRYFFTYQVDWMYWRYFMWNFVGRQNDIQGHGDNLRGNWISGVSFIDQMHVGSTSANAPSYTKDNPAHNVYFFLPLILGIIGLVFHFHKSPKDAFAVLLTFIFTGIAIVIYLNQKPFEPRERDYAYVASFYAFALWIGVGIYALFDIYRNFSKKEIKGMASIIGTGVLIFLFAGISGSGMGSLMSWLFISGGALLLIGSMLLFKKLKVKETTTAIALTVAALFVPILMGFQNWDDHDRSQKSTAYDVAHDYLESVLPNGIIFTNGDNDTFPLWYYQEVEGKRTDVRVCNLSLLGTDWYSEQMKNKVYLSDPLPIKFTSDQILAYNGGTDQVPLYDLFSLFQVVDMNQFKTYYNLKYKYNSSKMTNDYRNVVMDLRGTFAKFKIENNTSLVNTLRSTLQGLDENSASAKNVYKAFSTFKLMVEGLQKERSISDTDPKNANIIGLQDKLMKYESEPNTIPLEVAMAFVRDDKNMISHPGIGKLRVLPGNSFTITVNKKNVLASKLVAQKDADKIVDKVFFSLDKSYVTKDYLMMLDILSNFDWKRPIFFSSSYSNDISASLYQNGFVKQVGITYELLPVKDLYESGIDQDRMYRNLMDVYTYGRMNEKGTLTDYYARRHTVQFKGAFLRLAEYYVNKADNNERNAVRFQSLITNNTNAPTSQLDSLRKEINSLQTEAKSLRKKAILVLNKSLSVMPIDKVLDYGERPQAVQPIQTAQYSVRNYQDGTLQEMVVLMYRAGDKKAADSIGQMTFNLLKENMNYFLNAAPTFIGGQERADLTANLNALFKLDRITNDETDGNPKGKFAKEISNYINQLIKKDYPTFVRAFKDMAYDAGINSSVANGYKEVQNILPALMAVYGYSLGGNDVSPASSNQLSEEQLMQLIESQQ